VNVTRIYWFSGKC